MIRLQQGVDNMGNMIISAMQQSDTIYVNLMVASTAQYVTPPAGANFCLFAASGGNDFWMMLYPTTVSSGLAIPAATATEAAAAYTIPELNPLIRQITGMKTIGLISGATPLITLAFYA